MASDEGAFDDSGINVADPNDRLGLKADYISLVQELALQSLVPDGRGRALEIGCGYGRLTPTIVRLGFEVIGIDPSLRLLRLAQARLPGQHFCVGALPNLPFPDAGFEAAFLINVLRPLHLMGIKEVVDDVGRVIAPGGRLIILDNLRDGDTRYVTDEWIIDRFQRLGLELVARRAVRRGRWLGVLAIRHGLVPRIWLPAIARHELARMAKRTRIPRWTYDNVIYVFRKPL